VLGELVAGRMGKRGWVFIAGLKFPVEIPLLGRVIAGIDKQCLNGYGALQLNITQYAMIDKETASLLKRR
jgi:hypothetical protein